MNYSTKKNYAEDFLTFIRTEQRKSNVMKSGRIQPFCGKYNINIGCFHGPKINPRNITQRKKALFIHKVQFCLIWKSQSISFNLAIEIDLKPNFKFIDNDISDKYVKSFIK